MGFPSGSLVKNLPANTEMQGMQVWSLGIEDSLEEGIEAASVFLHEKDPMDRGAWWAIVSGVTKSQTKLSNWASKQPKWFLT